MSNDKYAVVDGVMTKNGKLMLREYAVRELNALAKRVEELEAAPPSVEAGAVPDGYAVVERGFVPEEAITAGVKAAEIMRSLDGSLRDQIIAAYTDMVIKADISDSLNATPTPPASAEPLLPLDPEVVAQALFDVPDGFDILDCSEIAEFVCARFGASAGGLDKNAIHQAAFELGGDEDGTGYAIMMGEFDELLNRIERGDFNQQGGEA